MAEKSKKIKRYSFKKWNSKMKRSLIGLYHDHFYSKQLEEHDNGECGEGCSKAKQMRICVSTRGVQATEVVSTKGTQTRLQDVALNMNYLSRSTGLTSSDFFSIPGNKISHSKSTQCKNLAFSEHKGTQLSLGSVFSTHILRFNKGTQTFGGRVILRRNSSTQTDANSPNPSYFAPGSSQGGCVDLNKYPELLNMLVTMGQNLIEIFRSSNSEVCTEATKTLSSVAQAFIKIQGSNSDNIFQNLSNTILRNAQFLESPAYSFLSDQIRVFNLQNNVDVE